MFQPWLRSSSPSLPCSFPLSSASSFVLVFTAASICCQKATWPWSFCTHSPKPAPGTCPSHTLTPSKGCTWCFRCHCPFLLLSNPLGQWGHKPWPHQSPRETPGLLLLLFPISSAISKVSVVFSSCDCRKSPPCCLNKSLGWLCRVSSPSTALLAVFAEWIESMKGQGMNHLTPALPR